MLQIALIGSSTATFLSLSPDRTGWPTFWELVKEPATAAWIQAIGSIGAIAAAAWVVYRQHGLEKERRQDERRDTEVARINGVMLLLMRQFNALLVYRKQILEPVRQNAIRHFLLTPILPMRLDGMHIDWRELAFVVQSPAKDLFMDAILAHEAFLNAVDLINERNLVHLKEFQPRLEESGIGLSNIVSTVAVEQAAGPRLSHMLKGSTDSLYESVDRTIELLGRVGEGSTKTFSSIYQGHKIVGFKVP
jgi:hypothetical protein